MYIIKRRSRRRDEQNTFYWVVGGVVACSTIEGAVDLLFTERS